MNFASLKPTLPRLQRSAVALALAVFGASASAANLPFTVDGDGSATAATPFRADKIVVSDFARVTTNALGTTFEETGYLPVVGFEFGPLVYKDSDIGLGTAFNMYVDYRGAGTLSGGDPRLVPTQGSFTSLTYDLYGYSGTAASFVVNAAGKSETASGEVLLASGVLIPGTGSVGSFAPGGGQFRAYAGADLTFVLTDAGRNVFTQPRPFYDNAEITFIHNRGDVQTFAGGFTLTQGGGSIGFAAPIPEPETYALMLAGLAAVGFVARRRRPQN